MALLCLWFEEIVGPGCCSKQGRRQFSLARSRCLLGEDLSRFLFHDLSVFLVGGVRLWQDAFGSVGPDEHTYLYYLFNQCCQP